MEVQFQPKMIDINNQRSSFGHNERLIEYGLSDLLSITGLSGRMATNNKETTPKAEKITYSTVTEKDKDEVLRLLKTFFFKDEPLNDYLKLGECKELELYSTKNIKEGCSFKAVNSKNEIVGVFINGILERPNKGEEPVKMAENCEHTKFKKILGLMDLIDDKFNIFDLYPDIDRALDGKILSVDINYRGMGISNELTKRTMEYMAENNIPLMHVLCSSYVSGRVMEKLGFHEVFSIPYSDYLDANGEQVLCPVKPHVDCRILVKRIIPPQ